MGRQAQRRHRTVRRRTRGRRRSAVGAALLVGAMAAIAVPDVAAAAPVPLTPAVGIDDPPPVLTADGVVGARLLTQDGAAVPDRPTSAMPSGHSVSEFAFREPAADRRAVLPSAATGRFTMTTDGAPDGWSAVHTPASGGVFDGGEEQPPTGTVHSDLWVSAANPGTWTWTLDFSSLRGGALPTGTVLFVHDVDICGSADRESVRFAGPTGRWLRYEADTGAGGPGAVTEDTAAGRYDVTATCPAWHTGVTQTFRTTTPVDHLTVTATGAEPGTTPNSGLFWGMQLPVDGARPALDVTTRTEGRDVDAAPGPRVPEGQRLRRETVVRNTGNTVLTDVRVTDEHVDRQGLACAGGPATVPVLEPGASVACTGTVRAAAGTTASGVSATGTPARTDRTPLVGVPAPTASDRTWWTGTTTGSGGGDGDGGSGASTGQGTDPRPLPATRIETGGAVAGQPGRDRVSTAGTAAGAMGLAAVLVAVTIATSAVRRRG
ncbi:hypothetical protein [Curtobacterium sp. MCBD17_028]|uniref:DUF7507 domain-containing protein n=1 Tax=Curtobacterium sp. MCBD17_028 TaxID=2175670 RepID=UPI000DA8D683|nr:hypothetical protein [Curtobacterium sp. MCBD17_028]PZE24186.1 hypothetical protein DEI86_13050 [Curtobacterium sp. MCBD17_028]